MKSVVAEASSISKAIELAWQKAGQPKEFLIKVYQEPQRNIFGLTKTSAKVGIFFEDAAIVQKIKTASQNVIPVANNTPQKRINSTNTNPQNKQISPIKPIINTPRSQAPKTQKPQQTSSAPTTPLANKPISEQSPVIEKQASAISQPINPTVNNTNNSTNINHATPVISAQNLSGEDLPKPANARKKYYRRRKPKASRPNGEHSNSNAAKNGPTTPSNKGDN